MSNLSAKKGNKSRINSEHGSHSVSSLLKHEMDVLKHIYFLFQACVKMKQVPTSIVISLFQACVKMKQVTLSSVYSWFQAC